MNDLVFPAAVDRAREALLDARDREGGLPVDRDLLEAATRLIETIGAGPELRGRRIADAAAALFRASHTTDRLSIISHALNALFGECARTSPITSPIVLAERAVGAALALVAGDDVAVAAELEAADGVLRLGLEQLEQRLRRPRHAARKEAP